VAACRAEGNGSAFLGIHDERGVSAFEEAVGRRPVSFTNAHAQALPAKLGVESFSRIDAAKLCSYDSHRIVPPFDLSFSRRRFQGAPRVKLREVDLAQVQ
jgi:hypothetical protein